MEQIIRFIVGIIAGFCMGQSLFKMVSTPPKLWKRVFIYLLLGITVVIPSWVGDENPILLFPFFMVGFLLFLSEDKLKNLVIAGIFYALLMPINMLMDSQDWDNVLLYFTLFSKAFMWCGFALFIFRIVPKGGLLLSKKLWLLLGGLTLAPLMSMLSFSIWGNTFQTDTEYRFYYSILRRFSFTVLPFVMISALALLIAAIILSRHEALEQETKLAALREVYYTGLKQEQTGLRTLRHDLRNHVTALQGLAEQGKQAELSRYLEDLVGSPALDGGKRYSNNETANVVLCSKVAQMNELTLIPDFEVSLPESLALSDIDLCALLGNSLDNAIDGVKDAENRTITLRVRVDKGMFMLKVQNAIGGELHSNLSTTKKDHTQHGYGLAGMREIATRHGGSLETIARNGQFELLVCFPCCNE